VTRLVGVDPDETMLSLAKRQSGAKSFAMECLQAGAESMPLADSFADTAVVVYALCTIPEPQTALAEIHRILKPGGRLVFLEHGQAEPGLRRGIQNRLNRVWGALAGGCNLNRDPIRLVRNAGFDVSEARHEKFPPSFWLLGSHYSGVALDVTHTDLKSPDTSFTNATAVAPMPRLPRCTAQWFRRTRRQ